LSDIHAKEADLEAPNTLSEYLVGKTSAAAFLKRIESDFVAPSEAEIESAVEFALAQPSSLAKATELCRLGIDQKVDSRVRASLRNWAIEIIRASHPDLQDWARSGGVSPEGALSILSRKLRLTRKRQDKSSAFVAEQVMRLGLIVTATWPNFDLVWSLSDSCSALHPGPASRNELHDRVRGYVLKASPKALESLMRLTRLVRMEGDPLRQELGEAKDQLQSARERNQVLQNQCGERARRIETLEQENEELTRRLAAIERSIEGVEGSADQDMIELRARYRSTLNRKLLPNLNDALEGLTHDPPILDVATHRIKLAARTIQGELEWLQEFLD
jgi:hypothetical protein